MKEDEKNRDNKRDSIRKILVGGGVIGASQALPSQWTNTVVNAVMLPAHAQTSLSLSFRGTGTVPSVPM
ncbi:MAG: hypothetical protein ACI9WC_001570 [Arenicella sp.]|jgi:hypothetical protein